MYTPRQSLSSTGRAQSSLDPNTGIRVHIQPSQSSYFAGEHFTCIITFTNTRSVTSPTQNRSLSASFNPGHKRAAHSVSSAPLARPPTSPGTPKTAQPFVASQDSSADVEGNVRRRGLIGKHATAATAALEKKRRLPTRSLSVDITPQDIIKRLADPGSPTRPSVVRTQSDRASPTSPRVSSPLAREHVHSLPPTHPHARKNSVVSDDMISQPSSQPNSFPPATPTASAYQISLDPITENSGNSVPPTKSESVSPHASSSSLIQPPPPPQPQGNRTGHMRRPSSLGLGLPLPMPGVPNVRVKSIGSQPPHSAFSTTFPPPSTELLLYAYAQLTGTLTIDNAAVPTSSELLELRTALRKRTTIGGGSLDIGSGTQRPRSSSSGSFFGFFSSPTMTGPTPNSPGLLSSFLGVGGAGTSTNGEEPDEGLPTLETQSSMLAVDLTLAAGESRSYSYSLALPSNLPPTFKGRALRFSYQLMVGTCRASSPFSRESSSGLFPPSPFSAPGLFDDSERRRSRVMRVPIRVYNYVAVGQVPRPYDLMWPVARRREHTDVGRVEEVQSNKGIAKQLKPSDSLPGVQRYAERLMAGEEALELEPPTGERGEGGELVGCREAVEIITRNPRKVSYDVSKDEEKVAVLTFVKSAYRLGETVLGVVELNETHGRSKVLKLSAMLEAHEGVPWSDTTPLRRVHAEHHSSLVSDMRRVTFALDIPSDASPAFEVAQDVGGPVGGLEWKVRLCLLVSMATGPGSAKGKGRAVEVRSLVRAAPAGEWGASWRASESIAPMELLRPQLSPRKATGSWTTIFNPFARGPYHDADEEDEEDGDGDEDWVEMSAETVECTVPLRVFAGNTAFRAIEVVFEV